VVLSTVFLGIDMSWGKHDPPQVFETMIFGGRYDGCSWYFSTWDEAIAGHRVITAAMQVIGTHDADRQTSPD